MNFESKTAPINRPWCGKKIGLIVNNLLDSRKLAGLEQKQMAQLMGMTASNYNRLEHGRDGRRMTAGHQAAVMLILALKKGQSLDDVLQEI